MDDMTALKFAVLTLRPIRRCNGGAVHRCSSRGGNRPHPTLLSMSLQIKSYTAVYFKTPPTPQHKTQTNCSNQSNSLASKTAQKPTTTDTESVCEIAGRIRGQINLTRKFSNKLVSLEKRGESLKFEQILRKKNKNAFCLQSILS